MEHNNAETAEDSFDKWWSALEKAVYKFHKNANDGDANDGDANDGDANDGDANDGDANDENAVRKDYDHEDVAHGVVVDGYPPLNEYLADKYTNNIKHVHRESKKRKAGLFDTPPAKRVKRNLIADFDALVDF